MSFLALTLVLGQNIVPESSTKQLDPKTRPFVELAMTKGRPFVSVNEYRIETQNPKKIVFNRVYRFNYRAEYAAEAKRWEKEFVAKGGWKLESPASKGLIVGRDLRHKSIRGQALILHPGKIAFDATQRAHTKTLPNEKGWVWVSYNEVLNKTK